jgi:hypothetical protein
MNLATQTRMAENHVFAAGVGGTPADNRQMLDRFRTHRPTLAEVNALVKACFANGKPVPDALERIARLG